MSGWLDAPAALPPGKYPPYPLNRRRFARFGEERIFSLRRDSIRESSSPFGVLTVVYRLWLCRGRVKIYRTVTSAGVKIVVSKLWENRVFQHPVMEHLGSYTPLRSTFRATRGQPEHHNMNLQCSENLHSSSNYNRSNSGEQVRTGKISVVAYLEDLWSFIPPFLWQNC